ncbi:MAG TPA: DUF6370 family protein [Sphingobacteriaceae bacterium]
MKFFITALMVCLSAMTSLAQQKETKTSQPDRNKKTLLVDAACGQCQLGLPGKSCDLAVRIDGKSYFVDGSDIDSHGDAHAKDGFCNAIRKAKVQGELVDNRFKASYFQLVPEDPKKTPSSKN